MNAFVFFAVAPANQPAQSELVYVLDQATPEAKIIIGCLVLFSIIAWSVMIAKAVQMARAKRLNRLFTTEYRTQKSVLEVYDRRVQADGCPMFMVYQAGSVELDARLKNADGSGRKRFVSLKGMEHIKRSMENAVAQESLKLESGLILLAIAVSGAPFLGLLGTVWGVMSTFGHVAIQQSATLTAMAPGVAAALVTTVAGLLVAIPSMFGYNWLVHNLRVLTVELDNFAQELVSKMETEYWKNEAQEAGTGSCGPVRQLSTINYPLAMRRFSQRSALVTLSEINITPLLDLAFVLLIIFVITTPLLTQSLPLNLPKGGQPDPKLDKKSIRTVEIGIQGNYKFEKMPMSLAQLESELRRDAHDPNLVVYIRADEMGKWKDVAAILDACQRNGITRISCRTEPPKRK